MSKLAIMIFQIICINMLLSTILIGAVAVKTANAQTPYLTWVTYYHNTPLMSNYPYGLLNQLLDIYKLQCDGTTEYDWYYYLGAPGSTGMQNQAVPGISILEWSSACQTYTIGCAFEVYAEGDLVNWGPETTDGLWSESATASINPSGGGLEFGASYQIPWVKVTDYSRPDLRKAAWSHEYNSWYSTSMHSHVTRPYFVIMISQDFPCCIDAQFATRWSWNWFYHSNQFWSSWQYFDAQLIGDG